MNIIIFITEDIILKFFDFGYKGKGNQKEKENISHKNNVVIVISTGKSSVYNCKKY